MNPAFDYHLNQTRRRFFRSAGLSIGSVALAGLLQQESPAANQVYPPLPGLPHFRPTAKRLIYLHMNGAPSQLDLFDYKPGLKDYFDKDLPDSVRNGQRITTMTSGQDRFPVAPSKFKFRRCGKSGILMSELVPYMQEIADDITMIKTVHTEAINHDPACTFVMTGSEVPGKPSLGSWLSYGLGSESNNLPAFVVFTPTFPAGSQAQALFTRMWSSGFLPSSYDGVALRGTGDPVLYIKNPPGVSRNDRRRMLEALNEINQRNFERFGDPETQTRIAQYEMAFRMQQSVPELTDLSTESQATLEMYGPNVEKKGTYASSAILARRLIERGVRFVQIFNGAYASGGELNWDGHSQLKSQYDVHGEILDQPVAGLLTDLKQRGLLDSTLVVFATEFGRMPMFQAGTYGRDHNPHGFTCWLAGAGVKPGCSYGATDEFGFRAEQNVVTAHDFHATILHLLGLDHERLTFYHDGIQRRLTNVHGQVIEEILS